MIVKRYINLFENCSQPKTAEILRNIQCDVMSLNVSGTFSSLVLKIQGTSNVNSENFADIAAIKLSDFSICKTITESGLYEISIEGIADIKVDCISISGGDVSVEARMVVLG